MSGQTPNSAQPRDATTSHIQETNIFSSQPSTTSRNDPTFVAIHDAFLLGWSLSELKSRVLIATANTLIPNSETRTASVAKVSKPTTSASDFASRASSLIDLLLSEVWSALQGANPSTISSSNPLNTSTSPAIPTKTINYTPLTNVWREIFKRIAFLHNKHFPHSNTNNTYYDPPDRRDLPYLYPVDTPDYSAIGISIDGIIKDGYLQNFKLYDSTRRALNCLTLLYTRPEESFSPETIRDYQRRLVQAIQGKQPAAAQGDDPQTRPSQHDLNDAIKICSGITISFLVAWDGYLRENFNAGRESENSEIEQMAYEAGYSLASLSWDASVMIAPIENALSLPSQGHLDANPSLRQHLNNAWLSGFDELDITSIQHQISTTSIALDEAYYRVHPNVSRQDANDVGVQLNPDLPSQAIRTVSESLNYWMRAVQLICSGDTQQQDGTSSNSVMPTPAPRPAAIPAMTWETSSQLRLALIQQAKVWQSLLAGHQSLRNFTTGLVTQRIWNDFSQELEQAISTSLLNPVEKKSRLGFRLVVVLGVLIIIFLGISELIPGLGQKVLTPLTGLLSVATVIVGLIGSFIKILPDNSSQEERSATTAVPAIVSLTGTSLTDTFQNGYKQILNEFGYLNYNVAVTNPLVEFFIMHSSLFATSSGANTTQMVSFAPKNEKSSKQSLASETVVTAGFLIKDAYDFLVHIVWTSEERADEIGRIARAAFGPIGAFVGAQYTPSSTSF